jgi:hypothetical protein
MNDEEKSVSSGELNLLVLPLKTGFTDNMDDDEVCWGCHEWIHYYVTPGYHDQWNRSTRRNHTPNGTNSWKCGSTGDDEYDSWLDAALETATFELHENSKLLFWHWIRAEVAYDENAIDGGIVEISVDGEPYEQITPFGGYPFEIWWGFNNPLPRDTPCFSGSQDWRQEEFDLSDYSGNAKIRFRFATSHSIGREGWYIDDVIVGTDPETQPVSIMMLPEDVEIFIGPSAGSFEYDIALVNNTDETQSFDWWIDLTLPSGGLYGPIETHTELLAPGETITIMNRVQNVPGNIPPGEYTYHGKVGTLPDVVESISSFHFTKMAKSYPFYSRTDVLCPRRKRD